ncbi:MAG: trypsin-like peptidase domain-containing protein, partial [Bacteroidales bacterium]|nr:trypsin-like peptidase domain-containing protein [Bacteroidales bacterium]
VVFITTERIVRVNPYRSSDFWGYNRRNQRNNMSKKKGLGSGFVISSDGYICTNYHVIKGVDKVYVNVHNKHYEAKIIGFDKTTDIALLKIKPKGILKPVYFGNSDKTSVGDWAIAIGNPFGLDRTFTVGVISAIRRSDVDMIGNSHIQTDASINPGNSGGPLINIYGEVIGINRMIYSKSGGNMGIGFAIPINTAAHILNQLKKYKKVKRGYVGIHVIPLTKSHAKSIGLSTTNGAVVGQVLRRGPADKGGLLVGDIILKVNNQNVKNYKILGRKIGLVPIGKRVKLTVWRNRRYKNVYIKVGERPIK